MHGGVKVYRGAASAARAYVEVDRSRADDYYLGEGTRVARRFGASPQGGVAELGTLDGDGYERWVAGCDPQVTLRVSPSPMPLLLTRQLIRVAR